MLLSQSIPSILKGAFKAKTQWNENWHSDRAWDVEDAKYWLIFLTMCFVCSLEGLHLLSLASSWWLFMTPLLALCFSVFYHCAVSPLTSSFSVDGQAWLSINTFAFRGNVDLSMQPSSSHHLSSSDFQGMSGMNSQALQILEFEALCQEASIILEKHLSLSLCPSLPMHLCTCIQRQHTDNSL